MYGPLLQCIESIRSNGWDDNSFIRVSGLLKLITYSTFIAAFHKIRYFFGFTHRFNLTLRGSECDILKVFQILGSVKQVLQNVRSNIDETFASAYVLITGMTTLAGLEGLDVPRKCRRQRSRNNVPASTTHEHFERSVFIPFFECFLREFNLRFTTLTSQAVLALNIIPAHVEDLTV